VTSILSEVRRFQAMAKVQESIGQMQASLGMEPDIESIDTASLADVTSAVSAWLEQGMDVSRMSALPGVEVEGEPMAVLEAE